MKKVILVALVSLLAIAAGAGAATGSTILWTNGSGDGLWSNPDNWMETFPETYNAKVPGVDDVATFGQIYNECTVDGVVDTNTMNMGVSAGYPNSLKVVSGGQLHFKGIPSVVISYDPNCASLVTVEQGGAINVDWQLTVGQWGSGTLTMNGGNVTCGVLYMSAGQDGYCEGAGVYGGKVRAQINLNAGTLKVTNSINYASRVPFGLNIDIKKGTLQIRDVGVFNIAAANAWANAGFITVNGKVGQANIKAETVNIGGVNYTQVKAACGISAADGDLSGDCIVNFVDLAAFATNWLVNGTN